METQGASRNTGRRFHRGGTATHARARGKRKVFLDLDLTLWDGHKLYDDTRRILERLRAEGSRIYCISRHNKPARVLEHFGIAHFFDLIISDRTITKGAIIKNLQDPNDNEDNNMFLDDQYQNLASVSAEASAECVYVPHGIKYSHVFG